MKNDFATFRAFMKSHIAYPTNWMKTGRNIPAKYYTIYYLNR